MISGPRIRPLVVGVGATLLLGGCIFPFPPYLPGDPGFGFGETQVIVINETDDDLVITFAGDFPLSYAIGGGETGTADLYAGRPTEVSLADAECAELDTLTLDADADPPEAIRIADGTLAIAEPPAGASAPPALFEFFECGMLGATVTAGAPAPAASGTILLEGEDGSAWTLEPATATLTPVSEAAPGGATFDAEFAWSPDGARVAFSRYGNTGQAIHVLEPGSGDARTLVASGATPAWSPDGTRIAYAEYDPFGGGQVLMVIDAEGGSEPEELAPEVGPFAWSPDGTRIAFVSYTAVTSEDFAVEELRVVDVETGEVTALAPASPLAGAPEWSPEGNSIAFTGGALQSETIHLVDASGGEPRVIRAQSGQSLTEPAWSPDGTRLAATLTTSGLFSLSGGLALIDVESGAVSVALEADDSYFGWPTWSPDGRHLAFVRMGASFASELVVLELDSETEVVAASGVLAIAGWR